MHKETKLTYIMPDDSMKADADCFTYSIHKGDVLIADPTKPIEDHDIVLAEVDGVPVVRMYHHHEDTVVLQRVSNMTGNDFVFTDAEAISRVKPVGVIKSRVTQFPHIDKKYNPDSVAVHDCTTARPIAQDDSEERVTFVEELSHELLASVVCGDPMEEDSNVLRMAIASALPTVDIRTLCGIIQLIDPTITNSVKN